MQERSRLEAGVGKELQAEDGALRAPFFGSRVEKLISQRQMVTEDLMHIRV